MFVNDVPVFVSPVYVNVSEGVRDTGYVAVATDANNDTLTYAISGGADGARFTLDSASGALSFIAAPLFGEPADINQNNIYTLDITAQDPHGGTATQTVEITVTDAPRVLTDLSVENTGSLLTASVACDECQLSATTFEWILEGSDAPVATGASYKLPAADQLKKITVKAIPVMESGASGQPEMAELNFNKAEKVVFSRGVNAVLKTNGDVVVWGNGKDGDADYYEIIDDVDRIIEPDVNDPVNSVAAVKKNGELLVRGELNFDGGAGVGEPPKPVDRVFNGRFIAAFKEDGVAEGLGGWIHPSFSFESLTNIRQLVTGARRGYDYPSGDLYGIDDDGNVTAFCWTDLQYCADTSEIDLTNVEEIVGGGHAFTALKTDGSLVSWGWFERSFPRADENPYTDMNVKLLSDHGEIVDVIQLVANGSSSFAALRSNNEVITWGYSEAGGNPFGVDLTNVASLYSNSYSFAAIKRDGSLVIWRETGKVVADNVKTLVADDTYYVAIKLDGTVGYWGGDGEDCYEELSTYKYDEDYNFIGSEMPPLNGVKEIIAGRSSFSLLKEDGTVSVWGGGNDGYSSFTNITKIFKPQGDTYAGLDVDGNLRIWGELYDVGDVPEEDLVPTLIEISSTLN